MTRFERLQLVENEHRSVRYVIEGVLQRQSLVKNLPPPSRLDVIDEQLLYVENGVDVLRLEHLEVPHPFNAREVIRGGVDAALVWAEAWARHESRNELAWIDAFADGLLLALCLGDDDAAQSLASYLDGDVCTDEAGYKPEDAHYHVVLARLIRGFDLEGRRGLVDAIEQGRSRRAKLLLKAAIAVFAGEPRAFFKTYSAYMDYFQKREFDRETFIRCASVEGSILWNLATRRGLEPEPLSPTLMDFIITPAILRRGGDIENLVSPTTAAMAVPSATVNSTHPEGEAAGIDKNRLATSPSDSIIDRDEKRVRSLLQAAQEAAEIGDVEHAQKLLGEATALTTLWGSLALDAAGKRGMQALAKELQQALGDLSKGVRSYAVALLGPPKREDQEIPGK